MGLETKAVGRFETLIAGDAYKSRANDVVKSWTNIEPHWVGSIPDAIDTSSQFVFRRIVHKAEVDVNAIQHGGTQHFNKSGSKYLREMQCLVDGKADVYAVLEAFNVTCPARQHAVKKLLCSGIRGKGDTMQDLKEARDAIDRAIQMESCRQVFQDKPSEPKS